MEEHALIFVGVPAISVGGGLQPCDSAHYNKISHCCEKLHERKDTQTD
jgi:hypothetical protein